VATERALLRAFEGLLQRNGFAGVGVNAVLDSAGVGKRLLYDYFGDLEGLAKAWAADRPDPLALGSRKVALTRRLARLNPAARISAILEDYAASLRSHPWAGEVLLADLQPQHNISRAIREIRREIGAGHEQLLFDPAIMARRPLVELAFVLHAAANYLALRARFAPDYNGIDLDTAAGWNAALRMLRSVAASGSITSSARPSAARSAAPGTRARRARGTRAAGRRASAASRPKRAR
jgi:AcrR family transcriptional regulator